jgi:phosphoribosyl 1,2-cyclic phosphate phosphodiesterase
VTFSHLDPDHIEGFRVVEQIALDFRTWRAYPKKQVCLLLPEALSQPLKLVRSHYGPDIDFYIESGFVQLELFQDKIDIGGVSITAIPVDRGHQVAFVHVFEKAGRRVIYAPCDIRPFPEHRDEVHRADLLIIQPGIFEDGLKHRFRYPSDHVSRTTLYTFGQTLELAARIRTKKVLFVHLEEYWNRSYDDYRALESDNPPIRFAYDGMQETV